MSLLFRVERVTVAAVAMCGVLSTACGSPGPGAAGGAAAGGGRGGPVPVEVVTLAEKPVEQSGEYVGTVRSRRSVNVQSQVEGFITKIDVKSGDRVEPGAVLFEIDATSQQALVANLESIRAARASDAALAQQQAERARKLLAAGAMSQQEVDQAEALRRSTEAQVKAVDEQIRQQRNELSYAKVTAATGGVIGDIPVRTGDRITKQTLLTTIEDNSALEMYLGVPVKDAPNLRLGQVVHLLDETGAVVESDRITFISPSVEDSTQTVLVKTPVSARAGGLREDQFVRARIVWSDAPALTVPLVAVTRISGQYFVYLAERGDGGGLVARQRAVTLGALVGNDYLVLGGLKAGDQVIVAGIQKIGDGAPVAPAAPKAGEPAKAGGR
jgi:RND family efflux transporter MFP subunit